LAVVCWTLNSCSRAIFRNPHDTTHPAAFRTFRMVTYFDYVLVSPFILVSAYFFRVDFFPNVEVVRMGDSHFLRFVVKHASDIRNFIYLLIVCLKRSSYSIGSAQRIRETLQIEVCCRKYKHVG